ncbi:MAG: AMP-binding protein [Sciscionella sp.]
MTLPSNRVAYLGSAARAVPDKPAVVIAETGETTSYRDLDAASNRLAALFAHHGLTRGDHIALLLENRVELFAAAWAAQRSGLYYTVIGTRLRAAEVAYIIRNCEAQAFIAEAAHADTAVHAVASNEAVTIRLALDGDIPGFGSYPAEVEGFPPTPAEQEWEGDSMLYSSGTTGRPKGVKRPLSAERAGTDPALLAIAALYGMGQDTVYLSPAPLYHAAPLAFSMAALRLGATVVIMRSFDPERTLQFVERYRVTHTQVVPTMFIRMLRLTARQREGYDLSSLRVVVHAAAPCPIEVKQRMIDWLGPILYEYYAGTEGNGMTLCDSTQWLAHPGTVGRAVQGIVHVLDDAGVEQPAGELGTVYFSDGRDFSYHGDADKTAQAHDPLGRGWSTLGDVGYLDGEGYLYLTDRRAHMIIRGGVNVYPQEAENLLALHPRVLDVAVIGVPDEELGEVVKAVLIPDDMSSAGPALERDILDYCRTRLARYKCPDSVDFVTDLPRLPTGKLQKRLLREHYR